MNKKKKLGKVVEQHLGFSIRMIMESKTHEQSGRDGKIIHKSFVSHSGKYGVYAGHKKFLKGDFISKDKALEYIHEFISNKK